MMTFAEFGARLSALATRLGNGSAFQGELAQAGRIIQQEARSALGTYRYGWPRLKAETIARKRTGDSPLLETGELRGSITYVVRHSEVQVGTSHPKAGWHTFGTSRGIPPRPFMEPAARAKEKEVVELIGKRVETFVGSL